MTEVITAMYENGVLHPLKPLKLRERQRVRIHIMPEETQGEDEAEVAIRTLVASGRLTPPIGHSNVIPLSEAERITLAERLGNAPGKPLSEIIIEDRGKW